MRRLSLLLITAAVAGCSAPADTPEPLAEPLAPTADVHLPVTLTDQQAEGRVIYESMCWGCHGPAGRGRRCSAAMGQALTAPLQPPRVEQQCMLSCGTQRQLATSGIADASCRLLQDRTGNPNKRKT